jgi:hypothetical protein
MAIVATADREVEQLQSDLRLASKALHRSMACTRAILRNIDNVGGIKQALKYDDEITAQELWEEIGTADQCDLMIAPTKGGAFTTKERAMVTSFWHMTVAEYEATLNR